MGNSATSKIDGLRSQKPQDQAAELLIYTPHRDVAVLRMTLVGPKGGVRSETVQLDKTQRRLAAAVLAGHSDWTNWARSAVRSALVEHLDEQGLTDDRCRGYNEDLADELVPVILQALHYTD
jgi:hypothetical protein